MLIYLQMIESADDKVKFETLYQAYSDYMYRVALAILRNVQDAEDAVHYAFVKIAENISKIEDPECLKTRGYIVTIVRNASIDIYRKKRKHPNVMYLDAISGVSVEYDKDDTLVNCILKLPERQRSVITLKYYHGYELKEVAKMLDITYANALKIEQRAKAKLRAMCEEEGIMC